MSKAGQNTITGISAQADVSLLKLVESFHQEDFEKILLEDESWEDFTLVFNDRVESYEVKWYAKDLSYHDVRSIIRKEIKKTNPKNYAFRIAAKSFSSKFEKDFNDLKRILPYLGIAKGNRPFDRNPLVRKFIRNKKWKRAEIEFVAKTELVSLGSDKKVSDQIIDLFRFRWDVFLSDADLKTLISVCFRRILEESQVGSSISRNDFEILVDDFEENLTRKSESFTPTISTATQTKNLAQFLTSPSEFRKLDNEIYLTPLTHRKNRALISYISKKIESSTFATKDIEFFIEKVLLKSSYLYTCIQLLKLKSDSGLLDAEYFTNFVTKNFHKLRSDFVVHDVLKLLLLCLKSDPSIGPKVLRFIQTSIFPNSGPDKFLQRADLDYSYRYQHLSEIIAVLGNENQHSQQFIDILFHAFDFTGDHFQLPTDTPSQVYSALKAFLQRDRNRRWPKLIEKIASQFEQKYNLPFKGYEYSGGGTGMVGWSFSFTDTGLVRKLYAPFFYEMLANDPSDFIRFLQSKIFKKSKKTSASNPAFIKRATVGPLLNFISQSLGSAREIEVAKSMVNDLFNIERSIPSARDALFSHLRSCNLEETGHEYVGSLLEKDISKNLFPIPSSVFAMETALRLLDEGHEPAKDILIATFGQKEFKTSWRAKEFLGALGNPNLFVEKQALKLELIEAFDIKAYLKQGHMSDWLNSDFMKNCLREMWKTEPKRATGFLHNLLSDKIPSKRILNLLANSLFELNLEFPNEIFDFFQSELKDKQLFLSRFKRSAHFRQSFARLAEASFAKGDFDAAKQIIDILIHDPDPNTNANRKKHEELKHGGNVSTISGVRTQVPWVLQKFAVQKDVEALTYALKKTEVTLDLGGRLYRRLGYYDRDFYVMANSIVPLIELAHPYRRNVLKSANAGRIDAVKVLALQALRFLQREVNSKKIKPVHVADYLIQVFFSIRDLNSIEAKAVLDFFEAMGTEESTVLVIYFAIFRAGQFRGIPFDGKPFKKRLRRLCEQNSDLRAKLALHFWQTLKDPKVPVNKVKELDFYVEKFYRVPEPGNLSQLAMILEDAFKSTSRYRRYFALMKSVMRNEIETLSSRADGDRRPRLHLSQIAPVLRGKDIEGFFEIFEIIIAASDPKTGVGVYGHNLSPFIDEFQKIGDVPPQLMQSWENIRRFLLGIGSIE
jgi:hypothetical protein